MTGTEHFREAEALLDTARNHSEDEGQAANYLRAAQVHATLAQAALEAERLMVQIGTLTVAEAADWRDVLAGGAS